MIKHADSNLCYLCENTIKGFRPWLRRITEEERNYRLNKSGVDCIPNIF